MAAPTVVVDVAEDDALMQEEIFGPILPILTVESLEKGIDLINSLESPLALYVFSDESSVSILKESLICIFDLSAHTIIHFCCFLLLFFFR